MREFVTMPSTPVRLTGHAAAQGDATMNKTDYRMQLKHQLLLGRRLEQVGLYTAAAESRNKAQVLLQIYRRHSREPSFRLN